MRRVAGDASVGLDRGVLKDEGSSFVGVAGEADCVLRGAGPQLSCQKSAMRIMTIAACDESLVYTMVIGLGKIRLNFKMAAIAQLRLAGLHQVRPDFRSMHGVTIDASDVVFQVCGAEKVAVLFAKLVAFQAALA